MINVFLLIITSISYLSLEIHDQVLPFHLDEPTLKIELSSELKEISGLTWYKGQLAAIQDESGILYLINPKTGKISQKINFAPPSDYEGIENIDNIFYALTSNGTIYKFNIDNPSDVLRINTPISWMNDAEGIAYNSLTNQLFIACKENGTVGAYQTKKKAIYALELATNTICSDPVIKISIRDLKKFKDVKKFKPSAISIDPLTCNIYILASVGKLLVVLNSDYKLLHVHKLSAKKNSQPEGICFSPKGDLFISNEGTNNKRANIYTFNRNNEN